MDLQQRLTSLLTNAKVPINELAFATASAVLSCTQQSARDSRHQAQERNSQFTLLVAFEFLHFFLSAISKVASVRLRDDVYRRTIGELEKLVIDLIVEMFVGALPSVRKSQLQDDLLQEYRLARVEYWVDVEEFRLFTMQSILGERLQRLYGQSTSESLRKSTVQLTSHEWLGLALDTRIPLQP